MATASKVRDNLRALLRRQRLTYKEVAQRLGLSEATLKRLLSGHTALTLQRVDELCQALGVTPAEVLREATVGVEVPRAVLSWEQEAALAKDTELFGVFSGLLKGLTFQDGSLSGPEAERVDLLLNQLVRLGLARFTPNGPQVLAERRYQWLSGGPLAKRYGPALRADFLDAPFNGPGESSHFLSLVLSERSKKVALLMEKRFIQNLNRLSREDLLADPEVVGTLTVFTALRPWTPTMFRA
ncbi:helix-turn-helix transcriptional regulator [Geothrix sp. PMB-07]|uniref:helix-turn-helix domain-containing protein n=1 Tax=Geothrix sp. PMB-07 TaxID=3068640 RepID=UPI0027414BB0|nr:helix-turn-helix transcriptional regulator [Geothrix sp. PMB-07]WLT31230.1 helix-turn-helix transcriptional regulator [Geothrix sp. PMB-07]